MTKLTKQQQRILDMLSRRDMTAAEIADKLPASLKAAQSEIRYMRGKGCKIQTVGKHPNYVYSVKC